MTEKHELDAADQIANNTASDPRTGGEPMSRSPSETIEDVLKASGIRSLTKNPDADELLATLKKLGGLMEGKPALFREAALSTTSSLLEELKVKRPGRLLKMAIPKSHAENNGTVSGRTIELLEEAPSTMSRPLALIDGKAYAATWIWIKETIHEKANDDGTVTKFDPPLERHFQEIVIIREDGELFSDYAPEAHPISDLGLIVHLPEIPNSSRLWSLKGVKLYVAGKRTEPLDVLKRIADVVNHFMDFASSLAPQREMCMLVALRIMATWFMEAFHVAGYVRSSGDSGSGKTQLLELIAEMGYLGQVVLSGGSFASLRDLADYGATICFDDAEKIMDPKKGDPDKQALLLAGTRRGATIPLKEKSPDGERWVTRYVSAYCTRAFSAIRLPDPVMGSRSISIPLIRSTDKAKMSREPNDADLWPHNRNQLIDDLWTVGLSCMAEVAPYERKAAEKATLLGRSLQPWQNILAVALWLEEKHEAAGLFKSMDDISVAYQQERADLETDDKTRVLLRAMGLIVAETSADPVTFTARELADKTNNLAIDLGLMERGAERSYVSPVSVGVKLKTLRFDKGEKKPERGKAQVWQITRKQ